MKSTKSCKNIVDYWNAVERFTPDKLETKNKLGYVESIQQEVLGTQDIPWQSRERFCHKQTPDKTWVYNIFLGITNYSDIIKLIKKMLVNDEEEFGLRIVDGVSCLCAFQLNNYGEVLNNTFTIPEYFISMACLRQKHNYPQNWFDLAPKIHDKIQDAYSNWLDILKNRPNQTVAFEDLKKLLADIINVSDVTEFHGYIRNNAIIYSSFIPVPNKFIHEKENAKEKFLNIEYYEEILDTIIAPDLNILNSFYLDDIKIVSKALNDKENPIGIGLKDYLGLIHKEKKCDLRTDKSHLRRLSNPEFLPSSRWPVSNKLALSFAQQAAVNTALSESDGIFSVNGPPGTGKTTLLRDIISEIVTNRAKVLAEFTNPKDVFNDSESISIDRFRYKVWKLDPRLLGHEIVVASSNNNAVENISKEIPRLSEIDQKYNLDYFSEIASHINNEECWGLGSAVLGNKINRSVFFDKFWSKRPNENNLIDNNYGLDYLLNTIKPKSDWEESRKEFLSTLAEFTELQSELITFKEKLKEYNSYDIEREKLFKQLNESVDKAEHYREMLKNKEGELLQIAANVEQKKYQLEETKKLEPKWYIIFLEFFKKESSYQKWSDSCTIIIKEISTLFTKTEEIKSVISELNKVIFELDTEGTNLIKKEGELFDSAEKNYLYINSMPDKYIWTSKTPDEDFWQLPEEEIQLSSPWIHIKLQDLRAKLFVDAMQLHYSFIVNSSEYISNNLRSMKKMATGEWPSESQHLLKDIWATFFIVVPSVSTTFASFGKLFKGLGVESLGCLLIDEAGQSSPQEALGAIYRAKRTIIVGDPMQIPPVVTIPKAIDTSLLEYYNVSKDWSVLEESVQTLSDRVNIYGTHIASSNKWVGFPLRVHRRCVEPMFSVANKIAYDNLMIQATQKKISIFDQIYPKSIWIDIQSNDFDGQWCEQQGEEVFKIIKWMISKHQNLPDLYVVSPFKFVAYKMKGLLRERSKFLLNKLKSEERSKFYNWINKSVGTIHTFQGKQSDGVILLLGGNPSKEGAITWVSSYPNILNVALTRAKYKFFVVGDYKLWSSKPHFQDLASVILPAKIDESLFEIA